MRRKIILSILFFLAINSFVLSQVESTTGGGPWSSPGTWKDGVVPAPGDNVIIKGPVTLEVITSANSVDIRNTGKLEPMNIGSTTYKLNIANYLWNNGILNGFNLKIFIGGNIGGSVHNLANGTWRTGEITFVDTLTHPLISEGKVFSSFAINAENSTLVTAGNVTIDSTTIIAKKIIQGNNLQNEKFTLNNSTLRVDNFINLPGDTSGLELQNNSVLGGRATSNVTQATYSDVKLKGEVNIGAALTFTGDIYNEGIMQALVNNYNLTINGNFTNNGTIQKSSTNKFLSFYISGNLNNNGSWVSNDLTFTGTNIHTLITSTTIEFSPFSITSTTSQVITGSDVRLDGVGNAKFKSIVLSPGNSLFLNPFNSVVTSLAVDTLTGNNNSIQLLGGSQLTGRATNSVSQPTYKNVILKGTVNIRSPLTFVGETINAGTMQSSISSPPPTLQINGNFTNNGTVKRNSPNSSLVFNVTGNLTNNGPLTSSSITMQGILDQAISIKDTSTKINNLFLDAVKSGTNYQWNKNGTPISGATNKKLWFPNAAPSDSGVYIANLDSSGTMTTSRKITIGSPIVTAIDNEKILQPKKFILSQNYPNPFNPSTIISYTIPSVGTGHAPSVLLKVYDVLGREVITLVNKEQSAGNYKINFDASSLTSGVYFYRIIAGSADGGFVQTKKMILLK